jgi:hypothetical protein
MPDVRSTMENHQHLDVVTDRQSFLRFVEALIKDLQAAVERERLEPSSPYGADAGGWENTTIESYLAAAVAWAKDSEIGTTSGLSDEPSWQAFAAFLYAGKRYE